MKSIYTDIRSLNGYVIKTKIYLTNKTNTFVIACHGFTGDKESSYIDMVATNLLKKNISTITFDWPSHGESPVESNYLTLNNCLNDITSIKNFLKKEYKTEKIYGLGTSFGGYMLLLYLKNRKNIFDKLLLRCPALKMGHILKNNALDKKEFKQLKDFGYLDYGFERKLKIKYNFYLSTKRNDIYKYKFKNLKNTMIIHGIIDDVAPYQDSVNFCKNNNIQLYSVKEADHRFKKKGQLEEISNVTVNFFLNNTENE